MECAGRSDANRKHVTAIHLLRQPSSINSITTTRHLDSSHSCFLYGSDLVHFLTCSAIGLQLHPFHPSHAEQQDQDDSPVQIASSHIEKFELGSFTVDKSLRIAKDRLFNLLS